MTTNTDESRLAERRRAQAASVVSRRANSEQTRARQAAEHLISGGLEQLRVVDERRLRRALTDLDRSRDSD